MLAREIVQIRIVETWQVEMGSLLFVRMSLRKSSVAVVVQLRIWMFVAR